MRLKTLADPSVATEPMSRELSELLIKTCMREGETKTVQADEIIAALDPKIAGVFQVQIMVKRLKLAARYTPELRFSPNAVLFCVAMAPQLGAVVAWAYTIVEIARRTGSFDTMALAETFPVGFPTRNAIDKYWDDQKREEGGNTPMAGFGYDNRLDMLETWLPEGMPVPAVERRAAAKETLA